MIAALRSSFAKLGERPSLVVAFSGGGDSSALLHVLATLRKASGFDLHAIHVNHGLHADAGRWQQQCHNFAEQLGVAFTSIAVEVKETGDGLEAAARDARYAALFDNTQPDDIIVLAHHRDDQAETVLLRLLRGSGSAGLGAMQPWSERSGRRLWRPWLQQPRSAIDAYCERHAIEHVHDPANRDPRHLRSRLRQQVMPLLRELSPSADAALGQSAALLREDAERLLRLDRANLATIQGLDPETLSVQALLRLENAEQRAAIRCFLAERGAPSMPARVMAQLDDLLDVDRSAEPLLQWAGMSLRRYRDLLYLCPIDDAANDLPSTGWNGQRPFNWPNGWQLAFDPPPSTTLQLRVAPREGGERIQLIGKSHSQDLNKLLQEAGIPPWERSRLPLLWLDADDGPQLLAVADLFRSESLQKLEASHGIRFRCEPHRSR
ncbi:MAG: tRNA lysidine(34) synthetase TilS [Xanthomonadales bacterium]|nr:tRNA lysidine(34) synthetase TilS [Xanthomonadales bacterium]